MTVGNIMSSVAECGGFLDSTADLGAEATEREDFCLCADCASGLKRLEAEVPCRVEELLIA